jgi:hypothetical protein
MFTWFYHLGFGTNKMWNLGFRKKRKNGTDQEVKKSPSSQSRNAGWGPGSGV